jgi:hypothetical protein
VTAFTVGHSITLTIAALGFIHVPSLPVEVLVAISIFVSALDAFRPIVPDRESFIAIFFGLIYGLAFAATLNRRLSGIVTPTDVIVDAFVHCAVWIAIILFLVSLACRVLRALLVGGTGPEREAPDIQQGDVLSGV